MSLAIGILADKASQVALVRQLVSLTPHRVVVGKSLSDFVLPIKTDIDLWIVCTEDCQQDAYDQFLDYIDEAQLPVIYDDLEALNADDRSVAAKILLQKITSVVGADTVSERAKHVWVLGASAGGPDAVAKFLGCLESIPEHTAFIYAQHLDAAMVPSLAKSLQRHTLMKVHVCESASSINTGTLYFIHPDIPLTIDSASMLVPVEGQWKGNFKPSIDQVMAKVARRYTSCAGAIIFSGMSDDGAASCRYLQHCGGEVWAQSPASCAVDSMPIAALKTGAVKFNGPPEVLASQFNRRFCQTPQTA